MRLSWTIVLALAPIALAAVNPVNPDTDKSVPVQPKCPSEFPDVCTTNCTVIKELPSPPKYSFQTQCNSTCVSLQFDSHNCGCCGKVVSISSGFLRVQDTYCLRAWVEIFVADFGRLLVPLGQDPRGRLQIWRLLLIFCQMAPTTPMLRRRSVQNTRGPGDIIYFVQVGLRKDEEVNGRGFCKRYGAEERKHETLSNF